MGVPDDWSRVYSWISADTVILEESAEKKSSYSQKCDEIPILDNYAVSPPDSFWNYFPSSPLPSTLTTPINTEKLKGLVANCKNWTMAQITRA
jgi:hypothetical protein